MRRVPCLAVDSPNKVKDILLITAYWMLIVSYVLQVVRQDSLIIVGQIKNVFFFCLRKGGYS